jgi:GNAT superfamily N-acetyltransferase
MPVPGSELDRVGMFSAARWLGDCPQTVIAAHALASGRCEAWAEGDPGDPRALLVRTHWVPTEPYAFGRDADALVDLLLSIGGWSCVNVGGALIETMPETLQYRTGREVHRFGDLYHVLLQRGPGFVHPAARLLNEEDEDLLTAAPPPVGPADPRTARTILREGVCAAAVIDGRIVSRVHAYPALPRHAELGAATSEPFRGRGLNTACASLVIEELLSRRVTPVWSTGENNAASRRVAEKLGFVPTTPRVYLRLS